jgi:hypothetical protein
VRWNNEIEQFTSSLRCVYTTHLLRRSYRDGDKVKNETLGNLSHLPDHVIELVRRSLRGEALVPVRGALRDHRLEAARRRRCDVAGDAPPRLCRAPHLTPVPRGFS